MSFRLASNPWYTQAYGHAVSRRKIPLEILSARNALLPRMQQALQGAEVTLLLDGWTNCRHSKMLNLLIARGELVVFWRTVPMKLGKAANVLIGLVKQVVLEYEAALKVTTVGVVADNENSNKALFGLIRAWRPCILCLGCNAHGL